jgi:cytidylate kinase
MFVVAVDGPAGSGKSSVSRAAAARLGFGYLDTGAGYRAFSWHAMQHPQLSIEELIASFDYEINLDGLNQQLSVAGVDVSSQIREPEVAARVSEFAAMPQVRALQLADARNRIENCPLPGIVVEGRDITTVVAPSAQVRVLLTASEAVRLQRRGLQGGEQVENLLRRDEKDSRVVDFMTPAPGVVLVDTTDLDFEQSVQALIDLVPESYRG